MISENSLDIIKRWAHRISLFGLVVGIILIFWTPFYHWLDMAPAQFGTPGAVTFLISFVIYIFIQFVNKEFDWIVKVSGCALSLGVVFIIWGAVNVEHPVMPYFVGLALIGTSILMYVLILFMNLFGWIDEDLEPK